MTTWFTLSPSLLNWYKYFPTRNNKFHRTYSKVTTVETTVTVNSALLFPYFDYMHNF